MALLSPRRSSIELCETQLLHSDTVEVPQHWLGARSSSIFSNDARPTVFSELDAHPTTPNTERPLVPQLRLTAIHGHVLDHHEKSRYALNEFKQKHSKFTSRVQVAFFTGLWCAVFGLPAYSTHVNNVFFGYKISALDFDKNSTNASVVCGAAKVRYQVYMASEDNRSFDIRNWEPLLHGPWTDEFPQIWCGYLPDSYEGYWPNVIQMTIFTVFANTGTTVQLAWQGVAGTACATVNIMLLHVVFPRGGRAHNCSEEDTWGHLVNGTYSAERPFDNRSCLLPGEWLYASPNYQPALVWFNTLFVTFLFLVSGAAENTMKFGNSWHLYFMMNFMNPKIGLNPVYFPMAFLPGAYYDSEYTVVLLTSIVGALIAILSTIFPFPISVYRKLKIDTYRIIERTDSIWTSSIKYFCGPAKTPVRMQIVGEIKVFGEVAEAVAGALNISWWETFDLCGSMKVLKCLQTFEDAVTDRDVRDLFYVVETVLLDEDFKHQNFVANMEKPMNVLKDSTMRLLYRCHTICEDGEISEEDRQELDESIRECQDAQHDLALAFKRHSIAVNGMLNNEYVFIYALSYWARKMERFAKALEDPGNRNWCIALGSHIKESLLRMWSVQHMTKAQRVDRLFFAARNWISIILCFIMGRTMKISVFAPGYSSAAPVTISLLISHFSGSAASKNTHRLLGVVVGKTLPIIIYAALTFVECGPSRTIAQFSMIVGYMASFCYLYYASRGWSLVGCLVAAFSCYPLLQRQRCRASDQNQIFIANYKELGQVTMAIIIQFVVDTFVGKVAMKLVLTPIQRQGISWGKPPRDIACDAVHDVGTAVKDAYQCFFDGSIIGLREARDRAAEAVSRCKSLAAEADPRLEILPGPREEFKHGLYINALTTFKLVLSDMSMLLLASETFKMHHAVDRTDDLSQHLLLDIVVNQLKSIKIAANDVNCTVKTSMDFVESMLRHADETPFAGEVIDMLKNKVGLSQIDGLKAIYAELHEKDAHMQKEEDQLTQSVGDGGQLTRDFRVRVCVMVQSLIFVVQHLADLDRDAIRENYQI